MLTVASIPAAHPYVRTVVDTDDVTLLDDPVPPGATAPGQWWPPRLLEPDYLRRRLRDVVPPSAIDLLHVHFGYDTNSPDELAEVVEVLAERRVPLIVTVHDLQNPHFVDQSAHAERLDVLVPAAAAVITLTDGAAAEIAQRWGREAVVLPHPHVLPIEGVGRPRQRHEHPVVGIHAKSLRSNIDPWPLLDRLIDGGDADWRLRLDLDEDVLGAPRAGEAATRRLDRYRRAGVEVRVHRSFTDGEMADYLAELDVMVLPYRHGTHSGWVEACHDAGVRVAVPDCGYLHRQHDDPVFHYRTGYFDPESFDDAVRAAVRSARDSPTTADPGRQRSRAEQRRRIQAGTGRLYRRALSLQHGTSGHDAAS